MHKCAIDVENDWRKENCPDYPQLDCKCPFEEDPCDDIWDCDEALK